MTESEIFNKFLDSYHNILRKIYTWYKENLESITDITKKNEIRKLYDDLENNLNSIVTKLKSIDKYYEENNRLINKLKTKLTEFIENSNLELSQDSAKELTDIKKALQKNRDSLLEILESRKIYEDLSKKITELNQIKHKKSISAGIGLLAGAGTGGAVAIVSATKGALGAAGCITLGGVTVTGLGLVGLGLLLSVGVFALCSLATYKVLSTIEEKIATSSELKELTNLIKDLINLSGDSVETLKNANFAFNHFDDIIQVGQNPMKLKEDRDLCERLSRDNDDISESKKEFLDFVKHKPKLNI
jgi:hypothetical protein